MEKKEAMKILKDFRDKSALFLVRTALDTVFPELAESEDEKIRNFLIDFIKVCRWTEKKDQGWPLREECVAWLEKQGEAFTEKDVDDAYLKGISEAKQELEKQGEQKSSWSEEDEKMCQETIDWFEKKCFPYALESENPARESIKWLNSLKDRYTWKPSEEQMETLEYYIDADICNKDREVLFKLYNDLKQL